jgi:radical SAM protein with 4Fe4S-binding SPASM domain
LSNSSTYCPLPFTHLHVTANGDVKPCCVARSFPTKVDVNKEDLSEVFNNTNFQTLRKGLLNNGRPKECTECWELENSNLESHRMKFIKDVPTHPKSEIVPVEFDYIDIRFSNVCNLKCIMCGGENSHLLNNGEIIQVEDKFVQSLKTKINNTRRIYFAGGEPLVMDQHYDILEYLSINNRKAIITYNTNLQVLEKGKYKVLDLWNKFETKPFVYVSCDGLYEIGEKIRVNFNTQRFIENIYKLKENSIQFKLFYTVGKYNVDNIPTFLKQVEELKLKYDQNTLEDSVTFSLVQHPIKYNIRSLDNNTKTEIVSKLNTLHTHNKEIKYLISYMLGKKNSI